MASFATLATALALYLTVRQFSLSKQQFISTIYGEMKSHFYRVNVASYNKKKFRETLNALDFISTSVHVGIVDEEAAFALVGAPFLELVDHIRSITSELEIAGEKKSGSAWIEAQVNVTWLEHRWRDHRKTSHDKREHSPWRDS